MKFNLKDFMQLDTKGLLAVNGGTSCSSSSSSSTGGSSSTSTGGGSGTGGSGSSVTTAHGGPGGRPAYGSDGTPISYEGSYSPPAANEKTTKEEAKPTKYGRIRNRWWGPIEWSDGSYLNENGERVYPPKVSGGTGESVSSGGGSCSSSSEATNGPSSSVTSPDPSGGETNKTDDGDTKPKDPEPSAYDKVLSAIIAKGNADNITKGDDPGEIKFAYRDNYQCDNYVDDILSSAGYNSKNYSVDDPNGKNVDKHIEDLKASGNKYQTDASKLTDGVYVVFMSDDNQIERSHAGLLFVDENGGSFIYDNSSHNFDTGKRDMDGHKIYDNGIEKYGGKNYSASDVIHAYQWCYEKFYFQKIN